jgi:energy-coupling factor transporter ATP-binding protein EcfA2
MDDPYFLSTLSLAGFRAYLQPKTFDFSKRRCLAIFAPNGSGKSSVIDALEFMFSKDGTLERLGQRTVNNQAGPAALAHNMAEEAKIAPKVTIGIISGKDISSGSRSATGAKRPIPATATTMNACFKVTPIIRGHALRTFVDVHTPEQRYADVANWLQLGPLVEVQKNIRALRSQVKAAADDETALQRVDTQLAKESVHAVKAWDAAAVLAYINTSVVAALDPALVHAAFTTNDPAYIELGARATAEENKIGLAGLRQIRNAAAALWTQITDSESDEVLISGAIPMLPLRGYQPRSERKRTSVARQRTPDFRLCGRLRSRYSRKARPLLMFARSARPLSRIRRRAASKRFGRISRII